MDKLYVLTNALILLFLTYFETKLQNNDVEYEFKEYCINNQQIFKIILDFVNDNYECINKSEKTYIYTYIDLDSNNKEYLTLQIEELRLNIDREYLGYYLFGNSIFLIDSTAISLDYFRPKESKNSISLILKPTFGFLLRNNDEYIFLFNDIFPINFAMRTVYINDDEYGLIYNKTCEYKERKLVYDSLLNAGWKVSEYEDFIRYREGVFSND